MEMNLLLFAYFFVLFYVLSPGVLVWLPPKAKLSQASFVHALIFAVIVTFTLRPIMEHIAKMALYP